MGNRYSCFQEALYNICKSYKKDFRCFFSREWGFIYQDNVELPIPDRISVPELSGMNRFLQNYMGFKIEFLESVDNMEKVLSEALHDGKKLLAGMDSYGCNWNPAYQKAHVPHFFVITEWDKQSGMIGCCDTYYGEDDYKLAIQDFEQYFRNLRIIQNTGTMKIIDKQELMHLIISNYESLEQNPLCYFELFSDCLRKVDTKKELFGNISEVENCMLIQKTQCFSINRKEIGRLLMGYPDIGRTLTETFFDLSKQWELLKSVLIKTFFQNEIKENYMEYIATLVESIGHQENDLYHCIKSKYVI